MEQKQLEQILYIFGEQIKDLRHAIGLDLKATIDYSFVLPNESLKRQLESDNRAMVKARLGSPTNEPDFDEFCRFVHYQVEALLYLYFGLLLPTKEKVNAHFKSATGETTNREVREFNDISEVNCKALIYSFPFSPADYQVKNCVLNVQNVRNSISHRTSSHFTEQEENTYNKYFSEVKGIFFPSLDKTKESDAAVIKLKNEGQKIEFRMNKDFNMIEKNLIKFIEIFKENIKKIP